MVFSSCAISIRSFAVCAFPVLRPGPITIDGTPTRVNTPASVLVGFARGAAVPEASPRAKVRVAYSPTLADRVICPDGGAMHIAAALGKPILCFFGDSDAMHWHPWGVPYRLLQPDSRDAADISLAAALQAFRELQQNS